MYTKRQREWKGWFLRPLIRGSWFGCCPLLRECWASICLPNEILPCSGFTVWYADGVVNTCRDGMKSWRKHFGHLDIILAKTTRSVSVYHLVSSCIILYHLVSSCSILFHLVPSCSILFPCFAWFPVFSITGSGSGCDGSKGSWEQTPCLGREAPAPLHLLNPLHT